MTNYTPSSNPARSPMAEGKGKWTSVFQTGGNRFIIRNERRADVTSIPTKVEGAADYANLIVTAVNAYPAVEGLVKALSELLGSSERHIFGDECKKEREAARSALSRFRSLQKGGANG